MAPITRLSMTRQGVFWFQTSFWISLNGQSSFRSRDAPPSFQFAEMGAVSDQVGTHTNYMHMSMQKIDLWPTSSCQRFSTMVDSGKPLAKHLPNGTDTSRHHKTSLGFLVGIHPDGIAQYG